MTIEDICDFVIFEEWIHLTICQNFRQFAEFGIKVKTLTTIWMVKDLIHELKGWDPRVQVLTFGGKTLQNNLLISDYGLLENSRINVQFADWKRSTQI